MPISALSMGRARRIYLSLSCFAATCDCVFSALRLNLRCPILCTSSLAGLNHCAAACLATALKAMASLDISIVAIGALRRQDLSCTKS